MEPDLQEIRERLLGAFGPQGWWPVTPPGQTVPRYHPGRYRLVDPREIFEVFVGAVLTQNTAWKNVELAIAGLNERGWLAPEILIRTRHDRLAAAIRPSGYYRQKARRLRTLARFFVANRDLRSAPTARIRRRLLDLDGVGPETADSILLYGLARPVFVIDAYTRRAAARWGLSAPEASYEELGRLFLESLPRRVTLFNEFHALIVKLAKDHCRGRPVCKGCPLEGLCLRRGV